jgi:hypothetical protein
VTVSTGFFAARQNTGQPSIKVGLIWVEQIPLARSNS